MASHSIIQTFLINSETQSETEDPEVAEKNAFQN